MQQKSHWNTLICFAGFWIIFYLYTGLIFQTPLHPYFDSYSVVLQYGYEENIWIDIQKYYQHTKESAFAPYRIVLQVIIGKYLKINSYFLYGLWGVCLTLFNFLIYLVIR